MWGLSDSELTVLSDAYQKQPAKKRVQQDMSGWVMEDGWWVKRRKVEGVMGVSRELKVVVYRNVAHYWKEAEKLRMARKVHWALGKKGATSNDVRSDSDRKWEVDLVTFLTAKELQLWGCFSWTSQRRLVDLGGRVVGWGDVRGADVCVVVGDLEDSRLLRDVCSSR